MKSKNARHHYQLSGHYKRELSIWLWLTQSTFVVCVWCTAAFDNASSWHVKVSASLHQRLPASPWNVGVKKFVIWNSEITHVRKCADCEGNSTSLITKRNFEINSSGHSERRYRPRIDMQLNDRIINSKQVKNEKKFVYMKSKQNVALIDILSTVRVRMIRLNSWIDARSSKGLRNGSMRWEQHCSSNKINWM